MPHAFRKFVASLMIMTCCQGCLLQRKATRPAAALNFEYLTLSAAVCYACGNQSQGAARIHFRIHHNHYIGFTVVGPMGMQLLRGKATPTHVTLLYPLQQTYAVYTYEQLANQWPGPWSYATLQAWLLGEVLPEGSHWMQTRSGKVTEQRIRTPRGRLVAHYGRFRPLMDSLFWSKATFVVYEGIYMHHPLATLTLTQAKAQIKPQSVSFDLEIPPHYVPQQ